MAACSDLHLLCVASWITGLFLKVMNEPAKSV